MNNIEMVSMAVRNLRKRKVMTFLTILGVVIGTAAIVVMISLGEGMNQSFRQQMENMGNMQIITVEKPNRWGGIIYDRDGNATTADSNLAIDDQTLAQWLQLDGVEAVSGIIDEYMIIGTGKYTTSTRIVGIDPGTLSAMGLKVSEGRLLEDGERNAALFGSMVSQDFRNPKLSWRQSLSMEAPEVDIINEKFVITYDWSYGTKYADKNIKGYKVEGVGILQGESYETAYTCYIPLEDMKKLKDDQEKYEKQQYGSSYSSSNKLKGYPTAWVKCYDMKKISAVQEVIKSEGFEAYSSSDYLNSMQEISRSLQGLLGGIGVVVLFVASINIVNIMLISVRERTKEIGVMKVVGASLFDIFRLFLVESAFIGFLGGVAGCGLSYLVSYLFNNMGDIQFLNMFTQGEGTPTSVIPIWLYFVGLGVATVVGILAGCYPAIKAMRMSALAALRTD